MERRSMEPPRWVPAGSAGAARGQQNWAKDERQVPKWDFKKKLNITQHLRAQDRRWHLYIGPWAIQRDSEPGQRGHGGWKIIFYNDYI